MIIEQVSQWIDSEVHSRRMWSPQSPDPPAFPYFKEAWVAAIQLVYHRDSHVRLSVSIASEVLRHRIFFSSPVRDVKTMAVDPVRIEFQPSFIRPKTTRFLCASLDVELQNAVLSLPEQKILKITDNLSRTFHIFHILSTSSPHITANSTRKFLTNDQLKCGCTIIATH